MLTLWILLPEIKIICLVSLENDLIHTTEFLKLNYVVQNDKNTPKYW